MAINDSKWEVNRVGLINFWYYDEEYFEFADGKMLLRGSNGSGKSVTMQSLFPVLLDGKTIANRLDSFGSRARKMEEYLLGEENVTKLNDRTGYLFIEYKKKDHDIYMTTGIGLKAKRGGVLTKWYFALIDNRRIGHDFSLFDEVSGDKLQPLSKRQLINRVESGGVVLDTQREYQELVNQRIFGFATISDFDNCINLLIQLRSPKLSKEFNPTVIFGILSNSLPTLKEDDLQTISNTLDQIDSSRMRLEQFEREKQALEGLNSVYTDFYDEKLRIIAKKWLDSIEYTKIKRIELEQHQAEHLILKEKLLDLESEDHDLDMNLAVWRDENEELSHHKDFQLVAQGQKTKEHLEKQSEVVKKLHSQLKAKESYIKEIKGRLQELEVEHDNLEKEKHDYLDEMVDHAESGGYAIKHLLHLDSSKRQDEKLVLNFWSADIKAYVSHLQEGIERLKEIHREQIYYSKLDSELGEYLENRDLHQKNQLHWQQTYREEREKLATKLHEWKNQLPFFLDVDVFKGVLRDLEGLYDEVTIFEFAIEPLYRAVKLEIERLDRSLLPLEAEMNSLEVEIKHQESERQAWQEQREPEPLRSIASTKFREQLVANASPFYDCVDFREELSEEQRNRIEGALLDSGILDALVTEDFLALEGDRQLIPVPLTPDKKALTEYLVADCDGLSRHSDYITQILRSIEVSDDCNNDVGTWRISTEGNYQMNLLRGVTASDYKAMYIGKASRERYRAEQINKINNELDLLNGEYMNLKENKMILVKKVEDAEQMVNNLPRDDELKTTYEESKKEGRNVQEWNEKLSKKQEEMREKKKHMDSLKWGLTQFTTEDDLELNLESYEGAYKEMIDYQDAFSDWKDRLTGLQYVMAKQKDQQQQLSIQSEEMDEKQLESDEAQDSQDLLEKQYDSIMARQKLSKLDDIKAQIGQVKLNIQEGEKRKKMISRSTLESHGRKVQVESKIEQLAGKLDFDVIFEQLLASTFTQEFKRYRVVNNELEMEDEAKGMIQGWEYNDSHLYQFERKLDKVFSVSESNLLEYRPSVKRAVILSEPDYLETYTDESDMSMIENWRTLNQQKILEVNSEGAWIHPQLLIDRLNSQIEQANLILRESDEELFEQIIFHSVGKIIRQLIQKAQRWVIQMNAILKDQDNSSGLTLSINWVPNTGDSDDELSTKELVRLLKKDTSILKESDTELMKRHFQAKIAHAKKEQKEEDSGDSLYQILQQVLDYRKWFQFEMKYHRVNEGVSKLNNNEFNKFSGGEKAICMYLPLFTAVYSRYEDASANAPYIISLDEAFAGIDELNIAELFKATEQLGFNYIMNSQSLQGEFATVSSLNTYELIRPRNAAVVGTLQYHWDGYTKKLILPKNGDEELVHE
ncbi:TIGR02680 family protein [Listeria newyorkensis]|uniref:TIGR02680 family protein n=1 Tax=Listeria newyorkensis TaxID=1497681 RepID=A0ABX4XP40_9LIST|nr:MULTISPECIES: TIGR02680 family protein [Listeria]KGL41339.1 hypothetical protein EP56_12210 [Listeriaceae bacterium FSL A5-0209]KGL44675.1 hypothetical protein EP58_04140 [Listeria newyorkensis]PNP93810.1 TIGR02680 family protein [Listeria newyorkensis]SQC50816.1 ATPase involved in DNA repair [Listeria newyorkensis]